MINPDDPTGIEDLYVELLKRATLAPIAVVDSLAALAQALGFIFEHARARGELEGVTVAELHELVDRYRRRGGMIESALTSIERKANAN